MVCLPHQHTDRNASRSNREIGVVHAAGGGFAHPHRETGRSHTQDDMAGHARTGQGQAGPDRAGFDRTLQDRVDQGRTGENSQTDIPTIHTYIDTYIQTDRQTGDLTASTYINVSHKAR